MSASDLVTSNPLFMENDLDGDNSAGNAVSDTTQVDIKYDVNMVPDGLSMPLEVEVVPENAKRATQNEPSPLKRTLNRERRGRVSKETTANIFSRLSLYWVNELFRTSKARRRDGTELEQDDMWEMNPTDRIEDFSPKFWKILTENVIVARKAHEEKHAGDDEKLKTFNASKALRKSLWQTTKGRMHLGIVLALMEGVMSLITPIILNSLLEYIGQAYTYAQSSDKDKEEVTGDFYTSSEYGFLLCLALSLARFLAEFCGVHSAQLQSRVSLLWRTCITTAVFRHTLEIGPAVQHSASAGAIVNFMHQDAQEIEYMPLTVPLIWSNILVLVGNLVILYYYVDWYGFAGIASMFGLFPLVGVIIFFIMKLQRKRAGATDERVKKVNELLQGIQGVKMGAWEEYFTNSIVESREKELSYMFKSFVNIAFFASMMDSSPALGSLVAILLFIHNGNFAAAPVLFLIVNSFNQLKIVFSALPQLLGTYVMYLVSTGRLGKFFSIIKESSDESSPDEPIKMKRSTKDPKNMVEVINATFHWKKVDIGQVKTDDNHEESIKIANVGDDSDALATTVVEVRNGEQQKVTKVTVAVDNTNRKEPESVSKDKKNSRESSTDTKAPPAIFNSSYVIRKNEITAVVGPVGSGKSSLCNAILGILVPEDPESIRISQDASVALVPQTAWMMNATLRENILFGETYDPLRYKTVIRVAQLEHDLNLMDLGDQTMIGEKGINLSGGQKQRVSIARAAYSKRNLVILDDPLSALDPKVASRVFRDCIVDFMADRTRVLVTNQLHFLKSCNSIVLVEQVASNHSDGVSSTESGDNQVIEMNSSSSGEALPESSMTHESSGKVIQQGTLQELLSSRPEFAKLMKDAGAETSSSEEVSATEEKNTEDNNVDKGDRGAIVDELQDDDLMTEEERNRGTVEYSSYVHYAKAYGGCWALFVLLLATVITNGILILNTSWVSFWSDAARSNYTTLPPFDAVQEVIGVNLGFIPEYDGINGTVSEAYIDAAIDLYTTSFGVLFVLITFMAIIPVVFVQYFALKAARTLHLNLLHSILRAPMSFFDTTPLGRIVSRFAKDIRQVDDMGMLLLNLLLGFAAVFSALIAISLVTPLFALGIVPLGVIYWFILHAWRPIARDVKRLEAISRSPVYAQFTETLTGLTTIQAYNRNEAFLAENFARVSVSARNGYTLVSIVSWRTLRLAFISFLVVLGSSLLALEGAKSGTLSDGLAGLSLTFAISFSSFLSILVATIAALELQMNSIERVLHYTNSIPSEGPSKTSSINNNDTMSESQHIKLNKKWPTEGRIEVSNLIMRYRDNTPIILKGVSFDVQPAERIGIVGRTGSGKSSLMLCLLRLVEPERSSPSQSGPIRIDGVDICKISLKQLRTKISIVPQHPIVFAGTIRSNLNPTNSNKQKQYSDKEMWSALEQSNLKTLVASDAKGLDMEIEDGGSNLSQGQRQLLALSRSILEKCKILLLDEATSSIDFKTDALIQDTIRNSTAFKQTTILVIAHRINTILDCDRILVLDNGHVAEYDTPSTLLSQPNSIFASMVEDGAKQQPDAESHS